MIQKGTMFRVIDNSGVKLAYCIGLPKGYKQRYAVLGDVITVAIKEMHKYLDLEKNKIRKGQIFKGVIVQTKKNLNINSTDSLLFKENLLIMLGAQNKIIGTRIFSRLPRFFRTTKFLKLLSLSRGIMN